MASLIAIVAVVGMFALAFITMQGFSSAASTANTENVAGQAISIGVNCEKMCTFYNTSASVCTQWKLVCDMPGMYGKG